MSLDLQKKIHKDLFLKKYARLRPETICHIPHQPATITIPPIPGKRRKNQALTPNQNFEFLSR